MRAAKRTHRDTTGIVHYQFFEMLELPLGNLSLLEVIGIAGNHTARIGIQCLLLGTFQLVVQHVQAVIYVGTDTDVLGKV